MKRHNIPGRQSAIVTGPVAPANPALCPACGEANSAAAFTCGRCGSSLIVARLVSRGRSHVPRGYVLALRCRDCSVGTRMNHDYILPSRSLPPRATGDGGYIPGHCLAVIYADCDDPLYEIPQESLPLVNLTTGVLANLFSRWSN